MRRSRVTTIAAGLVSAGLLLAACGDDDNGEPSTTDSPDAGDEMVETTLISDVDTANCTPASEAAPIPDPEGTGEDETEIDIANFPGWDENYVAYELLKVALEEQGYTVNVAEAEAGPTYISVSNGDSDLMLDAWLPGTHGDAYVDVDGSGEQLGDSLESLGCWFDEGFLTVAVNEDSPAQSLADLADNADEYGSRLVGIDPGAGLTKTTQEEVIPTYGLDDWDFPTSSSAAMLAELEKATNNDENIAVTLWHPHWAYAAYPIRDLEDPEETLGGAERLFSLGRPGFTEEYPNVAQLLKNFHLTDEQLLEIEDLMVIQNEREDNAGSIATWLEDNPDFLENWRNGEL